MVNRFQSKKKKDIALEIKDLKCDVESGIKELNTDVRGIEMRINRQIYAFEKRLNSTDKILKEIVSVGAEIDIHDAGNSWAVVCIEGHHNIVKFIDLSNQNGREVLNFMKNYEKSRYVYDVPPSLTTFYGSSNKRR